jgi:hypothetical protein
MLDAIEKNRSVKRKQIAEMARECGLGTLYDRFYPLQSMPSHGHSIGLSGGRGGDEGLFAMMASVRAYLKAIQFIVVNYITRRQATTLEELDGFINVGLIPPTDCI